MPWVQAWPECARRLAQGQLSPQESPVSEPSLHRTTLVFRVPACCFPPRDCSGTPPRLPGRARCLLPGPSTVPRACGIRLEDLSSETCPAPPSLSSTHSSSSPFPGHQPYALPFVRRPGLNGAPPTPHHWKSTSHAPPPYRALQLGLCCPGQDVEAGWGVQAPSSPGENNEAASQGGGAEGVGWGHGATSEPLRCGPWRDS